MMTLIENEKIDFFNDELRKRVNVLTVKLENVKTHREQEELCWLRLAVSDCETILREITKSINEEKCL